MVALCKRCIESQENSCGKSDRLNLVVSFDLHEISVCFPVSGLMRANLHPVHIALTVSKAACTSIKLGSGSGSLLPSPLLRLQHLTLGRSEALRNLPIQAGYCYYTFRNIA
jgi:hypothetical protein